MVRQALKTIGRVFLLLVMTGLWRWMPTAASAVELAFDAVKCENYQNMTAMLTGDEAEGDLFRIVRTGTTNADTSWCALSERVVLPADAVFAVVDFDIYSDADWRPGC